MTDRHDREPARDAALGEALRVAVRVSPVDEIDREARSTALDQTPFDEVDWEALRMRINEHAAGTLAGRRRKESTRTIRRSAPRAGGSATPYTGRRAAPRVDQPRSRRTAWNAARRGWRVAVPVAAAAAVALQLLVRGGPLGDEPAADAPFGDAAATGGPEPAAGEFVTVEDALFGDASDDELRLRVTGRADPVAWLAGALADGGI